MSCCSLDLQYPPGECRDDTQSLELWQRRLDRFQAVTRQLKARAGDWAWDLGQIRRWEKEAEDNIRRLQS